MTESAIYSPATYRLYSLQAAVAQAYATIRRHLAPIISPSFIGFGHAPCPGDTEVSIQWLTKILVAAGSIPSHAKITGAEFKGLDGNRGMAGVMTRILVTYTLDVRPNADPTQDSQELHLILKKSKDGRASRLGNIISGQAREATFYSSDLAKGLPKSFLPKVYYAHGSSLLGEYVILMEDIKQRRGHTEAGAPTLHPIDVNFVFGNQVWGLPPSVDPDTLPPPVQMLEQMFLTAASLHAQHWNDSSLLKLNWLKSAGWYRGANRTGWEWGVQAGSEAWARGKAKAASGDYDVKYSEKVVKVMDESFKRASWENLQRRLQDRSIPFVLSHGDFHASNTILDRSKSSASSDLVIFDWSEVCIWEPTTDLGQTVISDVSIPLFQAHARPALRKYWEKLVELGVVKPTEYTFETCWRHFLRGGVEKWLWVFGVLSSYPGMPAKGVQYFHDQILAFIELAEQEEDITYDITTVILFAPTTSP
ncbi:hypothetical protein BGZ80_000997 [Entomortierella chlamydospora]|uniref:Aminoglycoside phosphotransferase domain-containing protein n=1 Tax=Entomortierella chlamydospora TaxID=101097 RepID=A0A9P6N1Y0_9FUNG|nr:hypothetical protein BGZ79_001207 [Entomortierella chlamydospora]KAG0022128.1 hypothetical protein BGZ80_000997 [Entomortierella chlamydospora]